MIVGYSQLSTQCEKEPKVSFYRTAFGRIRVLKELLRCGNPENLPFVTLKVSVYGGR